MRRASEEEEEGEAHELPPSLDSARPASRALTTELRAARSFTADEFQRKFREEDSENDEEEQAPDPSAACPPPPQKIEQQRLTGSASSSAVEDLALPPELSGQPIGPCRERLGVLAHHVFVAAAAVLFLPVLREGVQARRAFKGQFCGDEQLGTLWHCYPNSTTSSPSPSPGSPSPSPSPSPSSPPPLRDFAAIPSLVRAENMAATGLLQFGMQLAIAMCWRAAFPSTIGRYSFWATALVLASLQGAYVVGFGALWPQPLVSTLSWCALGKTGEGWEAMAGVFTASFVCYHLQLVHRTLVTAAVWGASHWTRAKGSSKQRQPQPQHTDPTTDDEGQNQDDESAGGDNEIQVVKAGPWWEPNISVSRRKLWCVGIPGTISIYCGAALDLGNPTTQLVILMFFVLLLFVLSFVDIYRDIRGGIYGQARSVINMVILTGLLAVWPGGNFLISNIAKMRGYPTDGIFNSDPNQVLATFVPFYIYRLIINSLLLWLSFLSRAAVGTWQINHGYATRLLWPFYFADAIGTLFIFLKFSPIEWSFIVLLLLTSGTKILRDVDCPRRLFYKVHRYCTKMSIDDEARADSATSRFLTTERRWFRCMLRLEADRMSAFCVCCAMLADLLWRDVAVVCPNGEPNCSKVALPRTTSGSAQCWAFQGGATSGGGSTSIVGTTTTAGNMTSTNSTGEDVGYDGDTSSILGIVVNNESMCGYLQLIGMLIIYAVRVASNWVAKCVWSRELASKRRRYLERGVPLQDIEGGLVVRSTLSGMPSMLTATPSLPSMTAAAFAEAKAREGKQENRMTASSCQTSEQQSTREGASGIGSLGDEAPVRMMDNPLRTTGVQRAGGGTKKGKQTAYAASGGAGKAGSLRKPSTNPSVFLSTISKDGLQVRSKWQRAIRKQMIINAVAQPPQPQARPASTVRPSTRLPMSSMSSTSSTSSSSSSSTNPSVFLSMISKDGLQVRSKWQRAIREKTIINAVAQPPQPQARPASTVRPSARLPMSSMSSTSSTSSSSSSSSTSTIPSQSSDANLSPAQNDPTWRERRQARRTAKKRRQAARRRSTESGNSGRSTVGGVLSTVAANVTALAFMGDDLHTATQYSAKTASGTQRPPTTAGMTERETRVLSYQYEHSDIQHRRYFRRIFVHHWRFFWLTSAVMVWYSLYYHAIAVEERRRRGCQFGCDGRCLGD